MRVGQAAQERLRAQYRLLLRGHAPPRVRSPARDTGPTRLRPGKNRYPDPAATAAQLVAYATRAGGTARVRDRAARRAASLTIGAARACAANSTNDI